MRYVFFLCLDFKLILFTSTAFCTILTQFDVFQGPFYKLCRAGPNLFIFAKARLSTAYKMEFQLNRAKPCSTAQVAEALFIKPNVEPSRAWACAFYNSFLNKPCFFACKHWKLFMKSFREQHVKKLKWNGQRSNVERAQGKGSQREAWRTDWEVSSDIWRGGRTIYW